MVGKLQRQPAIRRRRNHFSGLHRLMGAQGLPAAPDPRLFLGRPHQDADVRQLVACGLQQGRGEPQGNGGQHDGGRDGQADFPQTQAPRTQDDSLTPLRLDRGAHSEHRLFRRLGPAARAAQHLPDVRFGVVVVFRAHALLPASPRQTSRAAATSAAAEPNTRSRASRNAMRARASSDWAAACPIPSRAPISSTECPSTYFHSSASP